MKMTINYESDPTTYICEQVDANTQTVKVEQMVMREGWAKLIANSTSQELFEHFSELGNYEKNDEIAHFASMEGIPEEVLVWLAGGGDWFILSNVMSNPNCPIEAIQKIARAENVWLNDDDEAVEEARELLTAKGIDW